MSELKLQDFLIGYPDYHNSNEMYNIYNDTVQHTYYRKTEFNETKLETIETLDENTEYPKLLKDQKFVSRFLSPMTLNDFLLAIGKVGTGKTIKAIAISELAQSINPKLKKTLVLVKGEGIERNFKDQLANVYNPQKYLPKNYNLLTNDEKIRRMNKLIEENYEFHTFITFTKHLKTLTPEIIKKIYSDRIIIIDEAHNLRLQDNANKELKVYETIHKFLHIIHNKKLILLSGTPMKDKADEIATLLNLGLPLTSQLPINKEFYKKYFDGNKLINKNNLLKKFTGYISYIRGMESDTVRQYLGNINGDMEKINTVISNMSVFQSNHYLKYYNTEKGIDVDSDNLVDDEEYDETAGFYDKSRQSSIFVFPDGSTGKEGFDKYVLLDKNKNYYLLPELINELTNNHKATVNTIINNIRKYGCKFADILENIINNPKEKAFIYSKYVKGSGAILFGELFKLCGYSNYNTTNSKMQTKKFVVISRKTVTISDIDNILNVFNNKNNNYGQFLSVIIGSAVIGEGRTLKDTRQTHILTPHWNNSETEQAIGRTLRAFAQDNLPFEDRYNKIYRWASVPIKNNEKLFNNSIDIYFYKMSEDKDILIKQIERIAKLSAVDCQLNKNRNLLPTDVDYSTECLYDKCDYVCDGFENKMQNLELIDDTYNLFFGEQKINSLINSIKLLYKKNFSYYIHELINIFIDIPQIIIIRSLKKLIDTNIEIKNKYNFISYLREYNNFYFLVDKVNLPNDFTLNYYDYHPNIKQHLNFTQIIKLSQYSYLNDKLNIINLTTNTIDEVKHQISTFNLDIQQLFLEISINNKINNTGNKLNEIIIDMFKNYIIYLPNNKKFVISTLLMETSDILRCYDNGLWKDCDDNYYKELDDIKEIEKYSLENTDINYYGVIGKSKNEFRIKFKDDTEVIDKRKKNRGIVCSTVVPLQRISNIAVELNIPPLRNVEVNKKNMVDKILQVNKKILNSKFKDYNVKYTKNNLNNMSDEELQQIYFWYFSTNKTEICDTIKQYFKDNELLTFEK